MLKRSVTHPRSLPICFLSEMWERYGFYTIQSLLAIYLIFHYHLSDHFTYLLVGSFTALTYTSPIIGGWVADKFIGQKNSILLGAVILFLSYLSIALTHSIAGMIACLSSIVAGTGLFKPNVSSILGKQYAQGDRRRDSGYTIFYAGLTLGIILGTIFPSKIKDIFGWSACFFGASIGMIFSFLVFLIGAKRCGIKDYKDGQSVKVLSYVKAILSVFAFSVLAYITMAYAQIANLFFVTVVLLTLLYVFNMMRKESPEQRKKTVLVLLLCVISVLFWAFYFQIFLSLTLLITRVVQPTVLGLSFPAPYYISIQSLGMIVFGIFICRIYNRFPHTRIGLASAIKFTVAIAFMLLAYGIILLTVKNTGGSNLISAYVVILAYLCISIAELLLSPIGLSMITQMSRPANVSTMMGVFYLSLGLGGFLSGKLAIFAALDPAHKTIAQLKHVYAHAFSKLSLLLLLGFILSLGMMFFIKYYSGKRKAIAVSNEGQNPASIASLSTKATL